jgi:hypothetical protein
MAGRGRNPLRIYAGELEEQPADAARYLEAALQSARAHGVASWEFAETGSGRCYAEPYRRHVVAYRPVNLVTLLLWLHEVGHIALGHGGTAPAYVAEFEACRFAIAKLAQYGFVLPSGLVVRVYQYVLDRFRPLPGRFSRRSFDARLAVEKWGAALRSRYPGIP